MASPKAPCATCGKGGGVCKCEGCSKKFCELHFMNHRASLKQQLENIVDQRNTFQNTLNEYEGPVESLIDQIELWEKEAIKKIQHAAKEARNNIKKLTEPYKGDIKKKLDNFTKQLNDAVEDSGYDERDLAEFTKKLKKLQADLNSISSSLIIHDESNTILVTKLLITEASKPIERNQRVRESSKSPVFAKRQSYDGDHDSIVGLSLRSSSERPPSLRSRYRPPSGDVLPSVHPRSRPPSGDVLPPVRPRSRPSSGVRASFPSPSPLSSYTSDRSTPRDRYRRRVGQLE